MRIMNLWGFFLSRKLGRPFIFVPMPRGIERHRLLDAYFGKRRRSSLHSDPLLPAQLANSKSKLRREHYNWLYLSVWLGLRPKLKDPKKVRIARNPDGTSVVWVYQTKIVSVPPKYRWKLIPLFLKEQQPVLEIIESGEFRRPLVKTVKRYFGEQTTLYGGRKGFTDLMLSYGQDFVNISQWMGHSTIQMTWRNYKSRLLVHHCEPAA